MDPNSKLNLSFSSNSQPAFSECLTQYETKPKFPAPESDVAIPQPLECLQGNPIPPFLSKTYDLVDDPVLDPIISWGIRGNSFVVWDPVELSRSVLPLNFKHNNFSSFVRQLNTYGFRKIDTDKWEFANEFFLRGRKHLLKNIRRRRRSPDSPQPQQITRKESGPGMETKLEQLKMEKSVMMQEVAEMQQQQRGTAERMESVKRRLQASEQRQKQMVSFVAKMVQNPEFIERVMEMEEERLLGSPRTRRKIAKKDTQEVGSGLTASIDEQPDNVAYSEMLSPLPQQHHLLEESIPSQLGYYVDFPQELAADNAFSEFPATETERLVKEEGVLSMGYDFDYNFPVTGPSSAWDLNDIYGGGATEIGKWQYDESPVGGCGFWE